MHSLLRGLIAATHTPFHADGSLAVEVVPLQARHLAQQRVTTAFVSGSTGEFASLGLAEREALLRAWRDAAQATGLTVIAHVGANALCDAKRLAAAAQELGLAGVAALSPSYFRPGDLDALVACCAEIAAAAPALPFFYYDIAVMTGVRFPADELARRALARIPNFAGIKFSNDDVAMLRATRDALRARGEVAWGVDERLFAALDAGAVGAVGSTYNFIPGLYHELMRARDAGDRARAAALQADAVRWVEALAGFGYMGACKALMTRLGVPVGPARLPLGNPQGPDIERLFASLDSLPTARFLEPLR